MNFKYEVDDIEFTSAVNYFDGTFLSDGVCYNNCSSKLLDGLVNHTKILDSYLCDKYGVDEPLVLTIFKEDIDKVPAPYTMRVENGSTPNTSYITLVFESIDLYINARNLVKPLTHTKLADHTEELLLCKAKDMDNTYLFFWYSKTRDNSIMRFETTDDIDTIKLEFKKFIDGLEIGDVYQLNPTAYNGWISNS
jgi:hypothetical protein